MVFQIQGARAGQPIGPMQHGERAAVTSNVLRFRARIEIIGVNPYVLVSAQRASRLRAGWRRPMPVLVQINGVPQVPWRINMMPRGDGSFFLYLAGIVREASGTRVDDVVRVQLQFDEQYRNGPMHAMPPWFEQPLSKNRRAQQGWERLPPSRKKEILRYFSGLKSGQAQQRNVQQVLRVLAGAQERFMARDWNAPSGSPSPKAKSVRRVMK